MPLSLWCCSSDLPCLLNMSNNPLHYLFWTYRACSNTSNTSSCTHSIFATILAINDKHMFPVKHLPTISPFGIDGNWGTWILFSPFDINVKENMLPLSCGSNFRRYQILSQHKLPLTGWTLLFEAYRCLYPSQSLLFLILGPVHLHLPLYPL